MESLKFEKEYLVHVYETGPNGKLNLHSLFNYMQDIASDHAENLGFGRDDLMKDKFPNEAPLRNAIKLDNPVEQGETSHCLRIKASDLDINLHTNNAGYLRLVCDTYDFGFLMKNDPQSVEINYLAESKYGEEITIRTSAENPGSYDHSIYRNEDGKELCRLRLKWVQSKRV